MEIIVTEDANQMALTAARHVLEIIRANRATRLMPATGNTPMGLYRELVNCGEHGEFDASKLRIIQLDDYLGLGPDDPRSLYGWMSRSLLNPLGIESQRIIAFDTRASDPQAACQAYDLAVTAAGGIDLVILGLGVNGHLGFNEPPSDANAPTRVIELSEQSVNSNAAYWGGRDRVPRCAITAGMTVVLAARRTILLASGERKAGILQRVLHGPISAEVPGSFLQRVPNVTVIADRTALPVDEPLP